MTRPAENSQCRRCGVDLEEATHPLLGKVFVNVALPLTLSVKDRAQCGPITPFIVLHEPSHR